MSNPEDVATAPPRRSPWPRVDARGGEPNRLIVVPANWVTYSFLGFVALALVGLTALIVSQVQTPQVPVRGPLSPVPSAAQSPTSTSPPAIRYQGAFAVDPTGKDLDLRPPSDRPADDGDDLFYNYLDGGLYPEEGSAIARWTATTLPSYSDCATYARAASVDSLKLKVGDVVCAHTSEGRYARLRVTALGVRYSYVFEAVVWELF